MAGDGRRAAVAGAIGNALIAAVKLFVGLLARNASLLAEAIHSTVDTVNSALILLGQRRAREAPDGLHPFGHGKELYFWTNTVSLVMFAVSGLAAIGEGVLRLVHPEELESAVWVYVVVAVAAVIAGFSLRAAFQELRAERKEKGIVALVRRSKDPAKFNVVLEDSAELAGLLVVAVATFLSHALKMPRIDAVGSILIGALMCTVAVVLANENRKLLVGERAEPKAIRRILALAEGCGAFREVRGVRTMQLGVNRVLALVEGELDTMAGEELDRRLTLFAMSVRGEFPDVVHLGWSLAPDRDRRPDHGLDAPSDAHHPMH